VQAASAAKPQDAHFFFASFATERAMREVTRAAVFFVSTPLLAARASAYSASATSGWAFVPSPDETAPRAFFTAVRRELFTARLRSVRTMRWRLRFSAEG
jgi:hypothetical protein